MESNVKNPLSKIKSNLYKRVEEDEKKQKIKLALIGAGALLFVVLLIVSASLVETNAGKYTYVYGDYEQVISKDQALSGKVQMIDMNALANYLGFKKNDSNSQIEYMANGTVATFYHDKSTALINGIEIKMPANAMIKNGYCLVPLSTMSELLHGIEISTRGSKINVSGSGETVYMIVNDPKIEYATDVSKYLEYINSKSEYIYTLTNKQNPIEEEFEPENLVEIPSQYSRKDKVIYLENTALQAVIAMINDMNELGISDIYVQSSYRSHAYQDMLFNMYIDDEMENGRTYEEALELANKYSARPEHSEHRTGLCVDFTTSSIDGVVDDEFAETEAFAWLKDNAWKYGFILRYPENKISITGYQYESWHFRFVGVERASIIYQTGLCYEEYLEIFENKGE